MNELIWFFVVLGSITATSFLTRLQLRLIVSKLDLIDQKTEELLTKLDNMAPNSSPR